MKKWKIRRKKGILKAVAYCLITTETIRKIYEIIPTTMEIWDENYENDEEKKKRKEKRKKNGGENEKRKRKMKKKIYSVGIFTSLYIVDTSYLSFFTIC